MSVSKRWSCLLAAMPDRFEFNQEAQRHADGFRPR